MNSIVQLNWPTEVTVDDILVFENQLRQSQKSLIISHKYYSVLAENFVRQPIEVRRILDKYDNNIIIEAIYMEALRVLKARIESGLMDKNLTLKVIAEISLTTEIIEFLNDEIIPAILFKDYDNWRCELLLCLISQKNKTLINWFTKLDDFFSNCKIENWKLLQYLIDEDIKSICQIFTTSADQITDSKVKVTMLTINLICLFENNVKCNELSILEKMQQNNQEIMSRNDLIVFTEINRLIHIAEWVDRLGMDGDIQLIKSLKKFNILDLVLGTFCIMDVDHEAILKLFKSNNNTNNRIIQLAGTSNPISNIEVNLLNQFGILYRIASMLCLNSNSNNFLHEVDTSIREIKTIWHYIDNDEIKYETLDTAYSLVFLRAEHFIVNPSSASMFQLLDSQLDDTKGKFICSSTYVLTEILKLLLFLLNIYQGLFNVRPKYDRYNLISSLESRIKHGLWRIEILTLLENSIDNHIRYFFNVEGLIEEYTYVENNKSDDDSDIKPDLQVFRYKRKRISKINDSVELNTSNSTSILPVENMQSDYGSSRILSPENRLSMLKLLSSPRTLLARAMMLDCSEVIQQLLKVYSFDDNHLQKEFKINEGYVIWADSIKEMVHKIGQQNLIDLSTEKTDYVLTLSGASLLSSKMAHLIEGLQTKPIFSQSEATLQLVLKHQSKYPLLNEFAIPNMSYIFMIDAIFNSIEDPNLGLMTFRIVEKLRANNPNPEESKIGHMTFCKQIYAVLLEYKDYTKKPINIKSFLNETHYALRSDVMKKQLKEEKTFIDLRTKGHRYINDIELLRENVELAMLCETNYVNFIYKYSNQMKYLLKLLNIVVGNNNDVDAILKINIKHTIGTILIICNLQWPEDLEAIAKQMHINLTQILINNLCGIIKQPQRYSLKVPEEFLKNKICYNEDKGILYDNCNTDCDQLHKIHPFVLNFINKKSSLIHFIISKFRNDLNEKYRLSSKVPFDNLLHIDGVLLLVNMLEGKYIAYTALTFCQQSVETIIKFIDRQNIKILDKVKTLTIVSDLEPKLRNELIERKVDQLICDQIESAAMVFDEETFLIIERLADVNLKAECVLDNISNIISFFLAVRLIENILQSKEVKRLNPIYKNNLNTWLLNIKIYNSIAVMLNLSSWNVVREISINTPGEMLQMLVATKDFDLCLEWAKIHPLEEYKTAYQSFVSTFNSIIYNNEYDSVVYSKIIKLIEYLPDDIVKKFYETILFNIRNLELLDYAINYLLMHKMDTNKQLYENFKVTASIFQLLKSKNLSIPWNLLSKPLLLIEQYIMNSKFELLSEILMYIRMEIVKIECEKCTSATNERYQIVKGYEYSYLDEFMSENHSLNRRCIDTLLRLYAAKSLNIRISENRTVLDLQSQSNSELMSLDSLCGVFVMPKEPPIREQWIKDEEALICMCCKRSTFTMLTRRHHCRRCGRVVCRSCSAKRITIPHLYADILVRICNDCDKQIQKSVTIQLTDTVNPTIRTSQSTEWLFIGDDAHDKLLRAEFSFEYAPSISLCLSIMALHSDDPEHLKFLLYHCQKFESLLKPIKAGFPNPEIDYPLIIRILHCLSGAAKVRDGPPECDTIYDRAEVISDIVQNGYETLLPLDLPSSSGFRALRDALISAEKWSLAIDVSLKNGFATSDVMAAWGLTCLKAGCYEAAREKIAYCMTGIVTEENFLTLFDMLNATCVIHCDFKFCIPTLNRPHKSPALLLEILNVLKISNQHPNPKTTERIAQIRHSNNSLSSINKKNGRNDIPVNEPSVHIINALVNIQNIKNGRYALQSKTVNDIMNERNVTIDPEQEYSIIKWNISIIFKESMYYLITYGSHYDILMYLIGCNELRMALKYLLSQCGNSSQELFIQCFYITYLGNGRIQELFYHLEEFDETFVKWKQCIIGICRYFETKKHLNCLYQLQQLIKDPIRASMSCRMFYEMNAVCYSDLRLNNYHLENALKHLQTELDLFQWEEIKNIPDQPTSSQDRISLVMKRNPRNLNIYISLIQDQIEVTQFFANAEDAGCNVIEIMLQLLNKSVASPRTLFGNDLDKQIILTLLLVCGNKYEEGYKIYTRLMTNLSLTHIRENSLIAASKYLGKMNRFKDVINFIEFAKMTDQQLLDQLIFECLYSSIPETLISNEHKYYVDHLISMMGENKYKLRVYIHTGQLKAAYLLAAKLDNRNDLNLVLQYAINTRQSHIQRLCERKLMKFLNS